MSIQECSECLGKGFINGEEDKHWYAVKGFHQDKYKKYMLLQNIYEVNKSKALNKYMDDNKEIAFDKIKIKKLTKGL